MEQDHGYSPVENTRYPKYHGKIGTPAVYPHGKGDRKGRESSPVATSDEVTAWGVIEITPKGTTKFHPFEGVAQARAIKLKKKYRQES